MAITRRLDPRVKIASGYKATKRVNRTPSHPFMLRTKPFQLQPHMISPVLPGETLTNMVTMSRVVTKPIKQSLVGWWCEYYMFYVRLRDIEYWYQNNGGGAFLDEMVTNPAGYTPPAGLLNAADAKYYHAGSGARYTEICTKLVTEYYFRDEGEQWDEATLDGLPLVQIGSRNWMDSLTKDSAVRDRMVDLDQDADGVIDAQEALRNMELWQAGRDAGLEDLDYEDWIRTFGVDVPEREADDVKTHKPELVRYWRSWQYPSNTVEPTTGVPSSAVSWVNAFRADKNRFFKEPGFLVGFTVQKPKLYLSDPTGSLTEFMTTLENWMPALSHKEYERGFKEFATAAGPLPSKVGSPAEGYWVDLRDLLVYGDQFLNFAPDSTASALSTLAVDGVGARYAKADDIEDLFASDEKYIQTDGITTLTIKGRQVDSTRGRTI